MRAFVAFIRLSRLKFLVGGFLGGALGTLVAWYERGSISAASYALAQLAITAAHLMTQYANEYYDRESDALTTRTAYSGGSGALIDGSLAPRVAIAAALVCLAIGLCGALALVAGGHALAGFLAFACAAFAWAYSAPPLRFLARGLGELDSALVVAVLVPLCAYAAQTDAIDLRALATTLPGAAAMFAMMLCVEVPDVLADAATGKRNLVVRYGARRAALLGFASLGAVAGAIALSLALGAPGAFALSEVACIVPMVWLAVAFDALRRGVAIPNEAVAMRGVAFFVAVAALGAIGYAQAVHAAEIGVRSITSRNLLPRIPVWSPLKIAQIAPLYESCPPKLYGGTERVVSYLTEELVAAGHEVTLFASGDSQTKARLLAPCERAIRLTGTEVDGLAYHTIMMHRVAERIAEFDILHFHTDYMHFAAFERFAPKTVTTLHGRLDAPTIAEVFTEFPMMPLVSISDAQRLPVPTAHWVRTIHHGLPAHTYELGRGDGGYLAFVGRISPEKGPDRAVAIAKGAGVPIRIAAKIDVVDRAYFENQIAALFEDPLVTYIGEIGDDSKSRFFGGALGLVFPIDWPEPFGLVMIEAMATGTPTIAFRHGSVEEIIEHGVTGFVVDTIEEAIAAVPKLAALDRSLIRKRFEERFSIRRVAEAYVGLYEQLAAAGVA